MPVKGRYKPKYDEDHPPKYCGHNRTKGEETCKQLAGHGTDHPGYGNCKFHFGNHRNGLIKAAKEIAAETMPLYYEEMNIHPADALLWCVRMTAGEVHYLTREAADMQMDIYNEVEGIDRAVLELLMQRRSQAMDRLAKYAKMACDAHIDERQVRVAEQMGTQLAMLLQAVLGDLELTPAQKRAAPVIVQAKLLELEKSVE